MPDAHTERPARLAGSKTYCACGKPWPCDQARMTEQQPALNAYKITIWCETGLDEPDLAMALEQGELWEKASNVQYQIDPARG